MTRKAITEKDGVHKQWYKDAEKVRTPDELAAFVTRLTTDYAHDYGTICHACAACAIAAAWAVNRSPSGGITGFQAGCIMWEFIRNWMSKDSPMRLVDFQDMLYPQYERKFQKAISGDVWEWLQEQAKEKLGDDRPAAGAVESHWESIADGVVPFGYEVSDAR